MPIPVQFEEMNVRPDIGIVASNTFKKNYRQVDDRIPYPELVYPFTDDKLYNPAAAAILDEYFGWPRPGAITGYPWAFWDNIILDEGVCFSHIAWLRRFEYNSYPDVNATLRFYILRPVAQPSDALDGTYDYYYEIVYESPPQQATAPGKHTITVHERFNVFPGDCVGWFQEKLGERLGFAGWLMSQELGGTGTQRYKTLVSLTGRLTGEELVVPGLGDKVNFTDDDQDPADPTNARQDGGQLEAPYDAWSFHYEVIFQVEDTLGSGARNTRCINSCQPTCERTCSEGCNSEIRFSPDMSMADGQNTDSWNNEESGTSDPPDSVNDGLFDMATIPQGIFVQGHSTSVEHDHNKTATVLLDAFQMSVNLITNRQYAAYLTSALEDGTIEVSNDFCHADSTHLLNWRSYTCDWFNEARSNIEDHMIVQLVHGTYASLALMDLNATAAYGQHADNRVHIIYDSLAGEFYAEPGFAEWPVTHVTWYGAYSYASYYGYNLPTEAEWEYVAAHGTRQLDYDTTSLAISCDRANFNGCSKHPIPVGQHPRNGMGVRDMIGQVWEWTSDWYEQELNYTLLQYNPQGPCGVDTKDAAPYDFLTFCCDGVDTANGGMVFDSAGDRVELRHEPDMAAINNDFTIILESIPTNDEPPFSHAPLYLNSHPLTDQDVGFSLGLTRSREKLVVRMADGTNMVQKIFNHDPAPLGVKWERRVIVTKDSGTGFRQVALYINKVLIDTIEFQVTGDIYADRGGLFGFVQGWRFRGTVHRLRIGLGAYEPRDGEDGTFLYDTRVLKGGSFESDPQEVVAAARNRAYPYMTGGAFGGFRIVKPLIAQQRGDLLQIECRESVRSELQSRHPASLDMCSKTITNATDLCLGLVGANCTFECSAGHHRTGSCVCGFDGSMHGDCACPKNLPFPGPTSVFFEDDSGPKNYMRGTVTIGRVPGGDLRYGARLTYRIYMAPIEFDTSTLEDDANANWHTNPEGLGMYELLETSATSASAPTLEVDVPYQRIPPAFENATIENRPTNDTYFLLVAAAFDVDNVFGTSFATFPVQDLVREQLNPVPEVYQYNEEQAYYELFFPNSHECHPSQELSACLMYVKNIEFEDRDKRPNYFSGTLSFTTEATKTNGRLITGYGLYWCGYSYVSDDIRLISDLFPDKTLISDEDIEDYLGSYPNYGIHGELSLYDIAVGYVLPSETVDVEKRLEIMGLTCRNATLIDQVDLLSYGYENTMHFTVPYGTGGLNPAAMKFDPEYMRSSSGDGELFEFPSGDFGVPRMAIFAMNVDIPATVGVRVDLDSVDNSMYSSESQYMPEPPTRGNFTDEDSDSSEIAGTVVVDGEEPFVQYRVYCGSELIAESSTTGIDSFEAHIRVALNTRCTENALTVFSYREGLVSQTAFIIPFEDDSAGDDRQPYPLPNGYITSLGETEHRPQLVTPQYVDFVDTDMRPGFIGGGITIVRAFHERHEDISMNSYDVYFGTGDRPIADEIIGSTPVTSVDIDQTPYPDNLTAYLPFETEIPAGARVLLVFAALEHTPGAYAFTVDLVDKAIPTRGDLEIYNFTLNPDFETSYLGSMLDCETYECLFETRVSRPFLYRTYPHKPYDDRLRQHSDVITSIVPMSDSTAASYYVAEVLKNMMYNNETHGNDLGAYYSLISTDPFLHPEFESTDVWFELNNRSVLEGSSVMFPVPVEHTLTLFNVTQNITTPTDNFGFQPELPECLDVCGPDVFEGVTTAELEIGETFTTSYCEERCDVFCNASQANINVIDPTLVDETYSIPYNEYVYEKLGIAEGDTLLVPLEFENPPLWNTWMESLPVSFYARAEWVCSNVSYEQTPFFEPFPDGESCTLLERIKLRPGVFECHQVCKSICYLYDQDILTLDMVNAYHPMVERNSKNYADPHLFTEETYAESEDLPTCDTFESPDEDPRVHPMRAYLHQTPPFILTDRVRLMQQLVDITDCSGRCHDNYTNLGTCMEQCHPQCIEENIKNYTYFYCARAARVTFQQLRESFPNSTLEDILATPNASYYTDIAVDILCQPLLPDTRPCWDACLTTCGCPSVSVLTDPECPTQYCRPCDVYTITQDVATNINRTCSDGCYMSRFEQCTGADFARLTKFPTFSDFEDDEITFIPDPSTGSYVVENDVETPIIYRRYDAVVQSETASGVTTFSVADLGMSGLTNGLGDGYIGLLFTNVSMLKQTFDLDDPTVASASDLEIAFWSDRGDSKFAASFKTDENDYCNAFFNPSTDPITGWPARDELSFCVPRSDYSSDDLSYPYVTDPCQSVRCNVVYVEEAVDLNLILDETDSELAGTCVESEIFSMFPDLIFWSNEQELRSEVDYYVPPQVTEVPESGIDFYSSQWELSQEFVRLNTTLLRADRAARFIDPKLIGEDGTGMPTNAWWMDLVLDTTESRIANLHIFLPFDDPGGAGSSMTSSWTLDLAGHGANASAYPPGAVLKYDKAAEATGLASTGGAARDQGDTVTTLLLDGSYCVTVDAAVIDEDHPAASSTLYAQIMVGGYAGNRNVTALAFVGLQVAVRYGTGGSGADLMVVSPSGAEAVLAQNVEDTWLDVAVTTTAVSETAGNIMIVSALYNIFVDGVLVANVNASGGFNVDHVGHNGLSIANVGCGHVIENSTAVYFTGYVRNVRVFNGILDADELSILRGDAMRDPDVNPVAVLPYQVIWKSNGLSFANPDVEQHDEDPLNGNFKSHRQSWSDEFSLSPVNASLLLHNLHDHRRVVAFDELSVTLEWPVAHGGQMRAPLVRGMPFITLEVDGLELELSSGEYSMPDEVVVNGQVLKTLLPVHLRDVTSILTKDLQSRLGADKALVVYFSDPVDLILCESDRLTNLLTGFEVVAGSPTSSVLVTPSSIGGVFAAHENISYALGQDLSNLTYMFDFTPTRSIIGNTIDFDVLSLASGQDAADDARVAFGFISEEIFFSVEFTHNFPDTNVTFSGVAQAPVGDLAVDERHRVAGVVSQDFNGTIHLQLYIDGVHVANDTLLANHTEYHYDTNTSTFHTASFSLSKGGTTIYGPTALTTTVPIGADTSLTLELESPVLFSEPLDAWMLESSHDLDYACRQSEIDSNRNVFLYTTEPVSGVVRAATTSASPKTAAFAERKAELDDIVALLLKHANLYPTGSSVRNIVEREAVGKTVFEFDYKDVSSFKATYNEDGPFAVDGFYPLYHTAGAAMHANGGDGTSHVHKLRSVTYYMPGSLGAARAGSIELYHGNYSGSASDDRREGVRPFSKEGFYPLYSTAKGAADAPGGDGYSHEHKINGVTYYMPGHTSMSPAGSIELFHGTYVSNSSIKDELLMLALPHHLSQLVYKEPINVSNGFVGVRGGYSAILGSGWDMLYRLPLIDDEERFFVDPITSVAESPTRDQHEFVYARLLEDVIVAESRISAAVEAATLAAKEAALAAYMQSQIDAGLNVTDEMLADWMDEQNEDEEGSDSEGEDSISAQEVIATVFPIKSPCDLGIQVHALARLVLIGDHLSKVQGQGHMAGSLSPSPADLAERVRVIMRMIYFEWLNYDDSYLVYDPLWGGIVPNPLNYDPETNGTPRIDLYENHIGCYGLHAYAMAAMGSLTGSADEVFDWHTRVLTGGLTETGRPIYSWGRATALVQDLIGDSRDRPFTRARHMDWYTGSSLVDGLEHRNLSDTTGSVGLNIHGYYATYLFGSVYGDAYVANMSRLLMATELHSSKTYQLPTALMHVTGDALTVTLAALVDDTAILFNNSEALARIMYPLTPITSIMLNVSRAGLGEVADDILASTNDINTLHSLPSQAFAWLNHTLTGEASYWEAVRVDELIDDDLAMSPSGKWPVVNETRTNYYYWTTSREANLKDRTLLYVLPSYEQRVILVRANRDHLESCALCMKDGMQQCMQAPDTDDLLNEYLEREAIYKAEVQVIKDEWMESYGLAYLVDVYNQTYAAIYDTSSVLYTGYMALSQGNTTVEVEFTDVLDPEYRWDYLDSFVASFDYEVIVNDTCDFNATHTQDTKERDFIAAVPLEHVLSPDLHIYSMRYVMYPENRSFICANMTSVDLENATAPNLYLMSDEALRAKQQQQCLAFNCIEASLEVEYSTCVDSCVNASIEDQFSTINAHGCREHLRLTKSMPSQTGAAWHPERQRVHEGFRSSFIFNIKHPGGSCRAGTTRPPSNKPSVRFNDLEAWAETQDLNKPDIAGGVDGDRERRRVGENVEGCKREGGNGFAFVLHRDHTSEYLDPDCPDPCVQDVRTRCQEHANSFDPRTGFHDVAECLKSMSMRLCPRSANCSVTQAIGLGAMGYQGIENSLVIEFDAWYDANHTDLYRNTISVHANFKGPNGEAIDFNLGSSQVHHTFKDAESHLAIIEYLPDIERLPDADNIWAQYCEDHNEAYDRSIDRVCDWMPPSIQKFVRASDPPRSHELQDASLIAMGNPKNVGLLRVFIDDTDEPVLVAPTILEEVLGISNERGERCSCTGGDVPEDTLAQISTADECFDFAECAWKMGWQGIEFNKEDFYIWNDLHNRDDSSPTHGLETSWVGFTSATGEAFEDHDILSWDFCEFRFGEEIINSTRCHPRGCEDASCFWMSAPVREGLAVNDDVGCPTGAWQGDCREEEGEKCLWEGHFECRE